MSDSCCEVAWAAERDLVRACRARPSEAAFSRRAIGLRDGLAPRSWRRHDPAMDHPESKRAWRPLVTVLALALALLGCISPTAMLAPAPDAEAGTQALNRGSDLVATAAASAPTGHGHFRTPPVDIARSQPSRSASTARTAAMRATPAGLGQAPNRPSRWATYPALYQEGIASRGGSPSAPAPVERLCSTIGGVAELASKGYSQMVSRHQPPT